MCLQAASRQLCLLQCTTLSWSALLLLSAWHSDSSCPTALLLQAEADLAACLFWEVRSFLEEAAARGRPLPAPLQVGVVTPYKQQKACLQETFKALCGEHIAAEVGWAGCTGNLHSLGSELAA